MARCVRTEMTLLTLTGINSGQGARAMTVTTTDSSAAASALVGVRIRADDLAGAVAAYETVLGTKAQRTADGFALRFERNRILLSDGPLPEVAMHDGKPRVGIWAVDLAVASPRQTLEKLAAQGHAVVHGTTSAGEGGHVDCNGVRVFVTALADCPAPAPKADVVFDHVALLVGGFDAPARFWETLTGLHSHRIDIHPVSNGTFGAVRLLLGASMVELVVPVPGTTSMLADRLAKLGEGPATLALPARSLDTKLMQLSAAGIATVERPPHWFVRPAQVAGVLMQLTPRVNH